ncbi:MAG: bifunctional acyl-ACP--phospholipid O-acyltransferase/long-chain-fatty-acid--ACP ligase [Methylococcaceae bacterium]|nr:MAG: bifunctional acyl-ACP--phospholipid O-acyltransferase/long-chain-fatty-acid--ACP ligase [Methylococcaceae bacterium]
MIKRTLEAIFRLLFRVSVHGAAPAPGSGKLLIIANHESFIDGILLGLFLPLADTPTFVVHTSVLKNPYFRLVLRFVPHLAVDPASPMAMKTVIRLLDAGKPVVIFPEGRITVTGSLMKVYEGPAFVAAKSGADILPVRLDGPSRSYFSRLSGDYPRRLLPRVTLTLLPITAIPMPAAPTAKLRRRRAGESMRRLMQEMLFASRPVQTLFSAFLDAIAIHGRRVPLLEDVRQQEESYGRLLRKCLGLGRLAAKFTAPDEIVGLLLPNISTTICLLFGLSAWRRVPAMLNYTAGSSGLNSACRVAKIATLFTSREFVRSARLEQTVAELTEVRVLYLEDVASALTWIDKAWVLAYAQWLPRLALPQGQVDEAAVVLFTSGSEGQPKGVVLSHGALLANVAQVRAVVDFSPLDKFFVALPVFHAFGLTCGVIMPMVTGSRLFLYPSPLHYRVIPELVYDRNCTVLFGTSTFLGNYAKCAHPYDFYRLRYVVSGAEKLSEEVRIAWQDKFGIRILEGYGATECAPVLAVNTPMSYRVGTVGSLLPGIEHRIVPVAGIAHGGRLFVRGPNLMLGYLLADQPGVLVPPASSAGDGWYDTGDIVELGADGHLNILGRVKRFAKIAGEMVSLGAVEAIAEQVSPQHRHAAVAQADAKKGEAIVLFTTDTGLTRELLQAQAKACGLPEIAVPRRVVTLAELPLLGTGKTDYVALQRGEGL